MGYFLTGEIYAMGRGIFLFVGGPLAGLIASIPFGHKIFYTVNALQAVTVTLLFFSAWIRVFTVSQVRRLLSRSFLAAAVVVAGVAVVAVGVDIGP